MFERFTTDARRVVTRALEVSGALRHDYLGTEHLLLGVAETGSTIATRSLDACGFDPARAREELERIAPPCPDDDLGDADAAALRAIGVDLDEVRRRTEEVFGPGALARRRRWHGRKRSRVCGLPFVPKAKQALELALREAIHLGHRWIGPEHVLLGLLRLDAMSTQLLANQGVDVDRVRAEVLRGLGELRERGA
jgi:ATP-dependent Clp protease ATP-binding subunit ClpA